MNFPPLNTFFSIFFFLVIIGVMAGVTWELHQYDLAHPYVEGTATDGLGVWASSRWFGFAVIALVFLVVGGFFFFSIQIPDEAVK